MSRIRSFLACMSSRDSRSNIGLVFFLVAYGYLATMSPDRHHTWQLASQDPGDYRYLAETFWRVPHDLHTYSLPEVWQRFLSAVPFRQIGPGTFYLFNKALFGDAAGVVGRYELKGLLAASYSFLATGWSRRMNRVAGLAALVILLGTTSPWTMGDDLLTEAFSRPLFCILAGLTAYLRDDEEETSVRMMVATQFVCLLLVQVKVQWLLLCIVFFAWHALVVMRQRAWKRLVILSTAMATVPMSLLAVNWIGWRYLGLTAGTSLHTMWKMGTTAFFPALCAKSEMMALATRVCAEHNTSFTNWGQFFAAQYPGQDPKQLIQVMDRASASFVHFTLSAIAQTVGEGYKQLTNFPPESSDSPSLLARTVDGLSFLLCILGGFLKECRLASLLCIASWGTVLVGLHMARWDPRYLTPMAGLPVVVGLYAGGMLYRRARAL